MARTRDYSVHSKTIRFILILFIHGKIEFINDFFVSSFNYLSTWRMKWPVPLSSNQRGYLLGCYLRKGFIFLHHLLFIKKVHFGKISVYELDLHQIDSWIRLEQEQTSVDSICVVSHDASLLDDFQGFTVEVSLSTLRQVSTDGDDCLRTVQPYTRQCGQRTKILAPDLDARPRL